VTDDVNPTLGELEAAGKLSSAVADGYERFLGAGWRTVTLQEATRANVRARRRALHTV